MAINKITGGVASFVSGTFGTPPNYSEFEADGTLVANGNATVWVDALGSIIGSRLESPASDIVQNTAEGSLTFETGCRYPTDYVTYNLQFNHYRKLASAVEFHIHWWQTTGPMPNWLVAYRWQRNGQLKETTWTEMAWDNNIFTWASGTLNQITELGNVVVPTGDGISDILQVRLYRDVTNVSTLFSGVEAGTANSDVLYGDSHIENDTLGSRQEYVK
jgi:hypothetical protein